MASQQIDQRQVKNLAYYNALVYRSTDFWVNATTYYTIPWSDEVVDASGSFTLSTDVYTCKIAGQFFVDAQLMVTDQGTVGAVSYMYIYHNSSVYSKTKTMVAVANHENTTTISTLLNCAVGDTIQLKIYSSTADYVLGGRDWAHMSIIYQGKAS